MECREVRQLAEAFVTEQLLVETTQAIVAHLEWCTGCRAEVDGLRRLRGAVRSAFEGARTLSVRSGFDVVLASRLGGEAARRKVAPMHRRRWLVVAASIFLVTGVGLGWREWSSSSLSPLLNAAVGDHQFCAVTFKLAEHPIALEEAARRFGVYGSLESVEPATDTLSSGPLRILARHSCVFEGRRFAHIVLRYKDETVSLLVTDDPRPFRASAGIDVKPSALPVTDGLHVVSFGVARDVVFVVSSLDDDDVQEVAQAMIGPVSRALTGT